MQVVTRLAIWTFAEILRTEKKLEHLNQKLGDQVSMIPDEDLFFYMDLTNKMVEAKDPIAKEKNQKERETTL